MHSQQQYCCSPLYCSPPVCEIQDSIAGPDLDAQTLPQVCVEARRGPEQGQQRPAVLVHQWPSCGSAQGRCFPYFRMFALCEKAPCSSNEVIGPCNAFCNCDHWALLLLAMPCIFVCMGGTCDPALSMYIWPASEALCFVLAWDVCMCKIIELHGITPEQPVQSLLTEVPC